MEAVIAFALIALTAILFYRFVERRHKLLLGKLILAGASLIGVVIAYLWISSHQDQARRDALQRSVTVTFMRDSSNRRNPYRSGADTVTAVSFRICNNGRDSVSAVSFWPKSLTLGRSSEYDIVIQRPYAGYRSGEFSSDYIMPPRTCQVLTWSGEYALLDTVVANLITVAATH